jgi:hypothetical protein
MSQPNAVLVPLVDSDGRKREPNKRMLEGVLFRFRPDNLDELKQKAGLVGRDLQVRASAFVPSHLLRNYVHELITSFR